MIFLETLIHNRQLKKREILLNNFSQKNKSKKIQKTEILTNLSQTKNKSQTNAWQFKNEYTTGEKKIQKSFM